MRKIILTLHNSTYNTARELFVQRAVLSVKSCPVCRLPTSPPLMKGSLSATYIYRSIKLAFKPRDSIIWRHSCTFSNKHEPMSSALRKVKLLTPPCSLWQGWGLLLLSLGRMQQRKCTPEQQIIRTMLEGFSDLKTLHWFTLVKSKHPAILFSGLYTLQFPLIEQCYVLWNILSFS